ncbi:MAG: ABC transporter ATP-binding protein [Synergistaceae bacterium]|jgi:peptide/nickel transport system ATP-binding protein|nr:ABC transporter ATP-binding protein [Synergistaceae bacterium]
METITDEKILEIEDLEVIYKTDLETVSAVNGIDISISRGKALGLVGETGAGKTTAALSIMRLLPSNTGRVTRGTITFEGRNLLEINESLMQETRGNRISMVFQDPMTSLNPVLTVSDQIAEAVKLHNPDLSKKDVSARVDDTLSMVGILPSRKFDYPHQFSGGMKQRVVIAMALCCEPALLIADEPTTALDVTIQAQVLSMMRELRNRLGTSLLMITHDLGIVAQSCDDVAVMYSGEIIESGTARDVFTGDEHHPYTVGLFNSIPDLDAQSRRLKPIPGLMPDPTNLPAGCFFAPRCENRFEACLKTRPATAIHGSHRIKCHIFNETSGGR